jgi:hypothetical protein
MAAHIGVIELALDDVVGGKLRAKREDWKGLTLVRTVPHEDLPVACSFVTTEDQVRVVVGDRVSGTDRIDWDGAVTRKPNVDR